MKTFKVEVLQHKYQVLMDTIPPGFTTKVVVSGISLIQWQFGLPYWTKKIYIKCIDGKYRNTQMIELCTGKSFTKIVKKK